MSKKKKKIINVIDIEFTFEDGEPYTVLMNEEMFKEGFEMLFQSPVIAIKFDGLMENRMKRENEKWL